MKFIYKLLIYKIIKDLKCLFFDKEFDTKLYSNIHLIGFNNSVYDLNNHNYISLKWLYTIF
jgi:hypothetical protein